MIGKGFAAAGKQRLHKDLRLRFVAYFSMTMILATLCTVVVSYLFISSRMEKRMRVEQMQTAQRIISMTDISEGIQPEGMSRISVISGDNIEIARLRDKLDGGEIVTKEHWVLPTVTTYLKIDDKYYSISMLPNVLISWQFFFMLITSVLMALLLGTIMAAISGNGFLRPIRELSRATEEVARGNFNVVVPTPANAEMAKLVENFNKMTADLAGIETLQREFTSNMSHEIKTPLASIRGFAELLQADTLSDGERKKYAAVIEEESARLSKLSSAILRLTKLENMEALPETGEFQLDEQLRRVIVLLHQQWDEKRIEMEVELDEVKVWGNEELLNEVWVNLLGNAIKFSPVGGQISVRLSDGLDTVIVEIEDDGEGMSETVMRRVFDKFYQGDQSHSGEGNGLGLALVKRIIELSHGAVEVESSEGGGALFRVVLPRE